MAKAKKLPSGNYRCQVYDYTDSSGKRHYESFTADTRKEAEYLAAEFTRSKERRSHPECLSLREAVQAYINIKSSILSPSTILNYNSILKNYIEGEALGIIPIRRLTNVELQKWVGVLSEKVSPKTVRNAYALASATLEMFCPELNVKISLPQKKEPKLYVPSDEDVKRLLDHIKGTELEIAVLLAAFGPMRRGEICALEASDIKGNIVTVNKAMVLSPDGRWIVKQPKTFSGYRTIEFPEFVIDRIGEKNSGRVIRATPSQVSSRFIRAIRFSHSPKFRFHDLRHYSASIMHAIGIPDQYIMERGGWASDNVMKRIYIGTIGDEKRKATGNIINHFNSMQHEMQHENKKA